MSEEKREYFFKNSSISPFCHMSCGGDDRYDRRRNSRNICAISCPFTFLAAAGDPSIAGGSPFPLDMRGEIPLSA